MPESTPVLIAMLLVASTTAGADERRPAPVAVQAPAVASALTHRAGFAKRAITPEVGGRPVYLAGFGNDRRATGVHDDLWARAAAFSDATGDRRVVLVSLDLIGVFLDEVRKAREELRARDPRATLVVASTHNHEGPDTMGLWGRGRLSSGVDRAYLERVRRAIVDTAAEALARLQAARLVFAQARTPGLIEDGRLPRVVDDTLVAVQVIDERGATLGTLVNWANHPEALGSRNTLVSSDFPDALRRRMEQALGGTSVFLTGAVGGLMTPLGVELVDDRGQPIPKDSFGFAEAIGRRAADAALAALRSGQPSRSAGLEHRSATVYLPLENRLFRLAAFFGVIDRRLFTKGAPASTVFGDDLESEVGWLRLGDAEALLVPGEIYPELVSGALQQPQDPAADFPGAQRERPLAPMLKSEFRMVLGLANDEVGYLIPRSQWDDAKPFAYGRAQAQYGEINSVGPAAAGRIAEAFAALTGR